MPTPLTGIPTPTYSPNMFTQLANMAEALEALSIVPFATEAARDTAIPAPNLGQTCFVAGASGGLCVYFGTTLGWQYLALRAAPEPEPTP